MDYGFVIDNRRCIGCHACTVACKAEHEIPLGCFRTWVKNVEKGAFPAVRRHFTVLRCNHCRDAPCVNICPTSALYHRSDGIVDFDRDLCIGCKSCIAACPYDAIYIDPDTMTAAKCNYCAHKVEVGLQPACVTVCPEQAIIAGDLQEPGSPIADLVALQQVSVRRPEKGTQPKVFYVDGDAASLTPGAAAKTSGYMWAQRQGADADADRDWMGAATWNALTAYDVDHARPWGFMISLYLWAKSMASGPVMLAAALSLTGLARDFRVFHQLAPLLAVVMTLVTTLLLVGDLKRPERFMKLLYDPHPRSWLVWGGYILMSFSAVSLAWLAVGLWNPVRVPGLFLWAGLMLATVTASYSAFLLAQARGRDLWQSPLLFPHLTVQAFIAGAALLTVGGFYFGSGPRVTGLLLRCLLGGLCLHGLLILSEIARPHGNQGLTGAIRFLTRGPLAGLFWYGAILAGVILPVLLTALYLEQPSVGATAPLAAAVFSLAGLLAFEDCYVRAGQALPSS